MRTDVIYIGDCIQGLKNLPDNSVDIVVTSPPYNINSNKYEKYKDNLSDEEYYSFIKECLNELLRVTKYYVFFNFQILKNNRNVFYKIMCDFNKYLKTEFIWAKTNPVNISNNGNICRGFEYIMCYSKSDNEDMVFKRGNYEMKDYISNTLIKPVNSNNKYNEIHSAIFPLWLPRYFIKYFSEENDIVLDPFMGSGTTAKACYELNRRFIGFEIDPEYCEIARKRLKQKVITGFFGTQANSTSSSFNKDLTGNSDEFPQILPLAELR